MYQISVVVSKNGRVLGTMPLDMTPKTIDGVFYYDIINSSYYTGRTCDELDAFESMVRAVDMVTE